MLQLWAGFRRDRRGATAIEYALVAGFLSVAIVAGVLAIGRGLQVEFAKPLAGFS